MRIGLLLLGIAWIPQSFAGFIEIGGSGNYRISQLNEDNYQKSLSYTGSISYYFWEMSALELSYTQGTQVSVLKISDTDSKTTTTTYFEMSGLDLVLTLADKQSIFLPYIKGGGAYIVKKMESQVEGFAPKPAQPVYGAVPSAGVGFKIKLTQALSFKAGVDGWRSPPGNSKKAIWDYAGRAGLSWMF